MTKLAKATGIPIGIYWLVIVIAAFLTTSTGWDFWRYNGWEIGAAMWFVGYAVVWLANREEFWLGRKGLEEADEFKELFSEMVSSELHKIDKKK